LAVKHSPIFIFLNDKCVLNPFLAPTGSGKTVLFELSIIHMLMSSAHDVNAVKCVYIAPTKVLYLVFNLNDAGLMYNTGIMLREV